MKPLLKGNLAELYKGKAVKVRKLKTGTYVEYIRRYECLPSNCGEDKRYKIQICGINSNNVPCSGSPVDWAGGRYFWQIADEAAVAEILAEPVRAYDWLCVTNGIRKKA